MSFHVGGEVVCIREPDWLPEGAAGGSVGETYTVRGVFDCDVFGLGLLLEEIVNPENLTWKQEWLLDASRFRPVIKRKTDISIFTAMLTPTKRTVDA
jgi:hypothetical protein